MPDPVRSVASDSDEQLMLRVQRGDVVAFEQLYERHATLAFGLARRVCHDAGRAEDAVQEAFLGMWRGRMGYRRTSGTFRGWAAQIVRHRAIDSIRRDRLRAPVGEPDEEAADEATESVEGQVMARGERDWLRASLGRIPRPQAEAISLAYFGQLTHSEIACQLSLPEGTVKGRIRLGLEKLRTEGEGA